MVGVVNAVGKSQNKDLSQLTCASVFDSGDPKFLNSEFQVTCLSELHDRCHPFRILFIRCITTIQQPGEEEADKAEIKAQPTRLPHASQQGTE